MRITSKEITGSLGEILYLVFFGLLLLAKGIGLYDGQVIFKIFLMLASVCLILKLAIEVYSLREVILMAVIMVLTVTAYFISGEKGLLLYGLMMVGLKNVDLKRVFTLGMFLWGTAFAITCAFSLFRLEDTVFKVHGKLGLGHIFRWSLGYPHPNVLQISYFLVAIFVIYLLGDAFKIKHALWLFLGNGIVFLYSVSYTGFIICTCLLVGRLYLFVRKRLSLIEKVLLQLLFPACVFMSLAAPVMIKGELFQWLNRALNTRMELAWRYLQPEYFSLFGIRVAEVTTESLTMDNSYLFAYITYGLIPFAALCLGTVYMIYHNVKKEKYVESLIILTIVIGGLTEPFLYNTSFKNVGFLFMGVLLFSHGNQNRKKEEFGCRYWTKEISFLGKYNPVISWNLQPFVMWHERINFLIQGRKKRLAVWGGILAVVFAAVVGLWSEYPVGYVVYRTECADLTKVKHYYDGNNAEYAGFKRMHDFSPKEEIEYFSGNIVKMEWLRGIVAGAMAGYFLGWTLGLFYNQASERRRNGGKQCES